MLDFNKHRVDRINGFVFFFTDCSFKLLLQCGNALTLYL